MNVNCNITYLHVLKLSYINNYLNDYYDLCEIYSTLVCRREGTGKKKREREREREKEE